MKIKCGFCIAYDWEMLKHSLPLVYFHVDAICLSLDKNRFSWSGKSFDFDEAQFRDFVECVDVDKKIKIYEDVFYLPQLSPGDNEVRQRNLMAEDLGKDGWHLQLDVDEYILNPEELVGCVKKYSVHTKAINICCQLITLFKQTETGFLLIENSKTKREFVPVLTNSASYTYGRKNGNFNVYSNILALHQSWARSEEEVKQKLESWGHVRDFNSSSFFSFWHSLSEENYNKVANYHPIDPSKWETLSFIPAHSLSALLEQHIWDRYKLSNMALGLKNSKWLARLKFLLDRIK